MFCILFLDLNNCSSECGRLFSDSSAEEGKLLYAHLESEFKSSLEGIFKSISQVITIHPEGNMIVCSKSGNGNASSSQKLHLFLNQNVNLMAIRRRRGIMIHHLGILNVWTKFLYKNM